MKESTRLYWFGVSPLVAFSLMFIFVVTMYKFAWSELFPPLEWNLLWFISTTILVCVGLAIVKWIMRRPEIINIKTYWNMRRVFIASSVLGTLTCLEFFHAGGIPILFLMDDSIYDYRNFGIKVLHVAIFATYNFLGVHWFLLYLCFSKKNYLIFSILMLSINVLILNRGAIVMCALSIGIIFVLQRGLRLIQILKITAVATILTVLFGILGDARMVATGMNPSDGIEIIGEASDSYPQNLGSSAFWVYLYTCSPLANLQLNVSEGNVRSAAIQITPMTFIALEILPDFIGKHLISVDTFSISPILISNSLNVSTGFGRAFYLAGWAGSFAVFFLFLGYYALIWQFFRNTEYFKSVMAMFSAGSALLVFHNMLTFSGFTGPLMFALILSLVQSKQRRRSI